MSDTPENPAMTPESAEEKNSVVRDKTGRFVKGVSGNPAGAPRKDPELRALCIIEAAANVAALIKLRDSSKDAWLRLEAIKVMLQYGFGKPALIGGGPLVAIDMRTSSGTDLGGQLSPEVAYRAMINGDIEPDPHHPAFHSRPPIEARPALPAPVYEAIRTEPEASAQAPASAAVAAPERPEAAIEGSPARAVPAPAQPIGVHMMGEEGWRKLSPDVREIAPAELERVKQQLRSLR